MGIIGIGAMITVVRPLDMILHALAPDGQLYTRGPMDHNGVRPRKSSPQSEVRTVRRFLRIDVDLPKHRDGAYRASNVCSRRHRSRIAAWNKSLDDGPGTFFGTPYLKAAAHLTHSL